MQGTPKVSAQNRRRSRIGRSRRVIGCNRLLLHSDTAKQYCFEQTAVIWSAPMQQFMRDNKVLKALSSQGGLERSVIRRHVWQDGGLWLRLQPTLRASHCRRHRSSAAASWR
jgi:hypothetical protein